MERSTCVIIFYFVGALSATSFILPDLLKDSYPAEDLETARVVIYFVSLTS